MAVPDSYREGSFGLGAGRLHGIPHRVPAASPSCPVLSSVSDIVGETAALIFTTAGTMAQISRSVPVRPYAGHPHVCALG